MEERLSEQMEDQLLQASNANNKQQAVSNIIKTFGDVNKQDEQGRTLLMIASKDGYADIVRELLKYNPKFDCDIYWQLRTLHWASSNGDLDIVKYLCDAGACFRECVNHKDYYKLSPVSVAVKNNHFDVVKYFFELGAELCDSFAGDDILDIAVEVGNIEMLEFLIKNRDLSIWRSNLEVWEELYLDTHFLTAVNKGDIESAKLFLKYGVEINKLFSDPHSRAHAHALRGSVKINALHNAAHWGQYKMAKWLVANDGLGDDCTMTWAVWGENLSIVQYFLCDLRLVYTNESWVNGGRYSAYSEAKHHFKIFFDCFSALKKNNFDNQISEFGKLVNFPLLLDALKDESENTFHQIDLWMPSLLLLLYFDAVDVFIHFKEDITEWINRCNLAESQELLNACVRYRAVKLLPELCALGKFDDDAFFIRDHTFTVEQCKFLSAYLSAQTVPYHSLEIDQCYFSSEEVWLSFIEVLSDPMIQNNLRILKLTNCNLSSAQLRKLSKIISMSKLVACDLEGNQMGYPAFRKMLTKLKEFHQNSLTSLSVRNNRINFYNTEGALDKFSDEINLNLSNSLKDVDISKNYFDSSSVDKHYRQMLKLILEKSQLTVEEFRDSKWLDEKNNPKMVNGKFEFSLEVRSSVKSFCVEKNELNQLREYQHRCKLEGFNELFHYLQKGVDDACLFENVGQKKLASLQSDKEKLELCKTIQRYHPKAPLKYYIHRHPIFHSERNVTGTSLIFPEREIGPDKWIVYILAHTGRLPKKEGGESCVNVLKNKAGDIFNKLIPWNEHAMIAWEGMTKSGQRILKVAHLKFDGMGVKISDLTTKTIPELPDYLRKRCIMASFQATRVEMKSMSKEVDRQINEGLSEKYEFDSYFNSQKGKQDDDKVKINCLRWSVDVVNKFVNLNIKPGLGHLPSWTIKKLKEHPEILDYSEPPEKLAVNSQENSCIIL